MQFHSDSRTIHDSTRVTRPKPRKGKRSHGSSISTAQCENAAKQALVSGSKSSMGDRMA